MIECEIFNETNYSPIPRKRINSIISQILNDNKIHDAYLNVVFTTNKQIKIINKEFLNHNYDTDVISFKLEDEPIIEGEIYISLEKATEQAKEYNVSLMNELLRLVAHGTLHIVGYDDDTPENRDEMHKLENLYISHKRHTV